MAKFVMMSMVFTVVLLKSAAIPIPKVNPKVFQVGDNIGWAVPKMGDNAFYKNWAAKYHFYVGVRLTFKFGPNSHVKRVDKTAYETCNALNTIEDLITDGNGLANVTLNSTGYYYFISPVYDNCNRGMKLNISVSNSSPAVSVGVLVPMMAVVMGFFF
ncbi:hypothetical protein LWI29_016473 [Acer saccharum]|uniref:Phytocyanin domain-containing protein n=1 Tax=Acer saccharum TaxID=4024 RepID=A0AA39SVX1_ACESA|nr:hypothetical protein LWI29_016473 [Acer saccharum]